MRTLLVCLLSSSSLAAPGLYTVEEVPGFSQFAQDFEEQVGMSEDLLVAGFARLDGASSFGYTLRLDGSFSTFNNPSANCGEAVNVNAISPSGLMLAGEMLETHPLAGLCDVQAMRFTGGASAVALGIVDDQDPVNQQSQARAVNDSGTVVGFNTRSAFTSTGGGPPQYLSTPGGGGWEIQDAAGINNAGLIVGHGIPPGGQFTRGVLINGGAFTELPVLNAALDAQARGVAISEAGVALGWAGGAGPRRGFTFDQGVQTALPCTVPVLEDNGQFCNEPVDINAAGEVVGVIPTSGGLRAAIFTDGAAFDLNDFIGGVPLAFGQPLARAKTITEDGTILAEGGGGVHYILTPSAPVDIVVTVSEVLPHLAGQLRFDVSVENLDPAVDANNVNLDVSFGDNVDLFADPVVVLPAGCTPDPLVRVLHCDLGTLLAGGAPVTLGFQFARAGPPPFSFNASATSDEADADLGNNTRDLQVVPDLSFDLVVDVPARGVGESVYLSVSATVLGSYGVEVIDLLLDFDPGLSLDVERTIAEQHDFPCTVTDPLVQLEAEIFSIACDFAGTFEVGDSVALFFPVFLDARGTNTLTVRAQSEGVESELTVQHEVSEQTIDLSVGAESASGANPGVTTVAAATVFNLGQTSASGTLRVSSDVPLPVLHSTPGPGSPCTGDAAGGLACALDELPPGASQRVDLGFATSAGFDPAQHTGTFTFTVEAPGDIEPSNDRATLVVGSGAPFTPPAEGEGEGEGEGEDARPARQCPANQVTGASPPALALLLLCLLLPWQRRREATCPSRGSRRRRTSSCR